MRAEGREEQESIASEKKRLQLVAEKRHRDAFVGTSPMSSLQKWMQIVNKQMTFLNIKNFIFFFKNVNLLKAPNCKLDMCHLPHW